MGARAIVDGAVLYGAKRIYEGIHNVPDWKFRFQFRQRDDLALFHELLHYIVLFDQLFFNSSSSGDFDHPLGARSDDREISISDFVRLVNLSAKEREDIIRQDWFVPPGFPRTPLQTIARSTVRLLLAQENVKGREALLKVPVPWAYREGKHIDSSYFRKLSVAEGLDGKLLPLAIFAWRGICYGAIASNMTSRFSDAVMYAAAPGRIAALRSILNADDIRRYERPRHAIREIQRFLPDLPDGYDFSDLTSFSAVDTSKLHQFIVGESASEQLQSALAFRKTSVGRSLRREWSDSIAREANTGAPVLGPSASMKNVKAGGSVILLQFTFGWPRLLKRAS